MIDESALYYESHVEIVMVDSEQEQTCLDEIATKYFFKTGDLLTIKLPNGAEEIRSFVTGKSKGYTSLVVRLNGLIEELITSGFKVIRYKIEDTIIDSKIKNVLGVPLTKRADDQHAAN